MPKISVIVPIYNVEIYLEKCLDSVINQTMKDIEIILVNDGSTDNSFKIIHEYTKKDSRIIVINQENKGLGEARNSGIKEANSKYLSFIDSDDFIEDTMLEELYNIAEKENSDIVKCRYSRINEDSTPTNQFSKKVTSNFNKTYFKDILSLKYPSVAWNALYKKELFSKNNLKFPDMYYEDIAFIFKLFFFSKSVTFSNSVLYNWRIREGSITRSINNKQIDDIFSIFDITYNFLNDYNCYKQYKKEFIIRCFKRINLLVKRTKEFSNKNSLPKYYKYIHKKIKTSPYLQKKNLEFIKNNDLTSYLKYLENISIINSYQKQSPNKLYKKDILGIKQNLLIDTLLKDKLKDTVIKRNIELKDRFKDKTCFILGQGSSFHEFDKSLLKDKFTIIFGNHFESINSNDFEPTFFIESDKLFLNENISTIKNIHTKYLFLPKSYKKIIKEKNSSYYFYNEDFTYFNYFDKNYRKTKFSKDISKKLYISSSTLHLCLQLAYYLGFRKIYLLGIDLNYASENLTIDRDTTQYGLNLIVKDFKKAKKVFEKDKREIINLSKNSILKMFKYEKFST
ncbi:glycosyltransferase [Arcobacter sp.]|uniref:glycosyltransferase n=1 Tax=Arcobacter sp. TaxID=1872629 RepID=UPI003C7681EA